MAYHGGMSHRFAVAGHWSKPFEKARFGEWVEELRRSLQAPGVSLGTVFMAPRHFEHAAEILGIIRERAGAPLLVGCSSAVLIRGSEEIEQHPGVVLGLHHLPGVEFHTRHFTQEAVEEGSGPGYWHAETGVGPDRSHGWLAFADPFSVDCDSWIRQWNEAYGPVPVYGGLASGDFEERSVKLFLNDKVHDEGVVVVSVGGKVGLEGVIAQGCTPIGETWTITKVEGNIIHEIAGKPAYQMLASTMQGLPPGERDRVRGNLFIGLVVNEYQEDFKRGDFLIRNILGGDPARGILAVGAFPRVGQTLQFQRRDAETAGADLQELLDRAHERLAGREIYGGLLCCCNGRGSNLFGYPSHDASLIHRKLNPPGLTGFFCNGEIGPVGGKTFLHGYTASLALFVEQTPAKRKAPAASLFPSP